VINIRGSVQTSNNLSRDTSVGVYLDGVPISKTTGSIFDLVDLERVEVLRGPQGTLYGKNTVGGALNLVTTPPGDEFGGSLRAGVGNEDLRTLRAVVDLGSFGRAGDGVGKFGARASFITTERDGFYDNDFERGPGFDNLDQTGGRLALAWDISDNFSINYSYDTFRMRQNPPMLAVVNGMPAADNERPDSIANDAAERSDLDVDGHSLQLLWDIGDTALGDLSLKWISAKRNFDNDSRTDFDGSDSDLFRFISVNEFEQWSHELQLLGQADNLDWVLGVFYYDAEWYTDNPRWIFQFGGDNFDVDQRGSDEEAVAIFGQVTWTPVAFDEQLDLTAGLRYTDEKKDVTRRRISHSRFYNPGVGPCASVSGVYQRDAAGCPVLDVNGEVQSVSADDSWSELTPMFVASWHLDDSKHVYGKVVTGFRSGGFNGVASTNESFAQPFDPETMTSYELGFKSRWLENRLQLNAAYFYNELENIQVEAFDPVLLGVAITNAGEATLQGVELEFSALPTDSLELQLNVAWLDSEYAEFVEGGVDVADERVVPYSPEYSFNAMIRHVWPTRWGEVQARLDYSWKDDHSVTSIPSEALDVEAYGLWDARLSLAEVPVGDHGELMFSLWGKNLTDEEYWDVAINLQVFTVAQWANPRSYGFDVEYNF
jgi:iron complex outermembrane receptor protein